MDSPRRSCRGIAPDSPGATFSVGVAIPELVFVMFQATFAGITAALLLGSLVERTKFAAIALFIPLWLTFVYFPIAHMVWYWAGPDAIDAAAKALAAADAAGKAAAQVKLDEALADAGYLFKAGAIDFAGGTVVHINSGIAGLVGALLVGKRLGYGKELMQPHSLTMTYIGAMLLWFGWFGFNAGSNLEAVGSAVVAFVNTFVATAAAGLSWMFAEWLIKGKPSLLGAVSGVVAGLVAVTPASGFAGPMGAIVLGLIAGVVCFFFCTTVKNALGYDDALDVFGVHCIGGIVGALGYGHPGEPGTRRHRRVRLHDREGRRVLVLYADDRASHSRGRHPALVRNRIRDPVQGRRHPGRAACQARSGARGSRHQRSRRARLQLIAQASATSIGAPAHAGALSLSAIG